MIDSMITKLLEEANEEADKKGWCDKEMAVNGQTREDKTEEVNTLTAEVDKLKADIMKLSEQIADLAVAIQEIDGAMVNATDIKGTEKELQSALFYYEKLKPQCVDAGVSYEERVAKREAEIESLKTALKILSDV